MNADYPRFGSIADVHLTSDDREMLMVCFRFICMSTGDLLEWCVHVHVCVCICVCDMQYYMYSTLRVAVSFETID